MEQLIRKTAKRGTEDLSALAVGSYGIADVLRTCAGMGGMSEDKGACRGAKTRAK